MDGQTTDSMLKSNEEFELVGSILSIVWWWDPVATPGGDTVSGASPAFLILPYDGLHTAPEKDDQINAYTYRPRFFGVLKKEGSYVQASFGDGGRRSCSLTHGISYATSSSRGNRGESFETRINGLRRKRSASRRPGEAR